MNSAEESRLMIVDDQPDNIRILMDAVGESCQVIVAKDGKKALQMAFSYHPDLILLDIMMPGMDGYDVCRVLKEDERTKDIPVIFVTALNDVHDEEKGLRLGAIDYIRKPFHLSVAKARIRNHLRLKRRTDMLEELVRIDGLTEIHNRRGLDETLAKQWKASIRSGSPISMVMVDIDYFKQYNDHYGHAKGDDCLILVARAIRCSVKRPEDFVARYGGEEFAVLLPDTLEKGALKVGEAIRREVEAMAIPHAASGVSDYVTISAGVASLIPKKGQNESVLVECSDKALYQAKTAGRNRVVVSEKGNFLS